MPKLPGTMERVPLHTAPHVQKRIRERTARRVKDMIGAPPYLITQRIETLEREWDIERALETNAAAVTLTSVALGAFLDKRWFALTAVVGGFLLQHALQGWCPPLPLLRRLGFRTAGEIAGEIVALRRLRGDFESASRAPGR